MADPENESRTTSDTNETDAFFQAFSQDVQKQIGYILLTLLVVDGEEVLRVYSSDTKNFPVAGRKRMNGTPWGDLVIKGKKNFLARDRQGLRWAFYDHALTESLGGGSQINIPVVYNDECVGTLNLTHKEHFYTETHVQEAEKLAPRLVPIFLGLIGRSQH